MSLETDSVSDRLIHHTTTIHRDTAVKYRRENGSRCQMSGNFSTVSLPIAVCYLVRTHSRLISSPHFMSHLAPEATANSPCIEDKHLRFSSPLCQPSCCLPFNLQPPATPTPQHKQPPGTIHILRKGLQNPRFPSGAAQQTWSCSSTLETTDTPQTLQFHFCRAPQQPAFVTHPPLQEPPARSLTPLQHCRSGIQQRQQQPMFQAMPLAAWSSCTHPGTAATRRPHTRRVPLSCQTSASSGQAPSHQRPTFILRQPQTMATSQSRRLQAASWQRMLRLARPLKRICLHPTCRSHQTQT